VRDVQDSVPAPVPRLQFLCLFSGCDTCDAIHIYMVSWDTLLWRWRSCRSANAQSARDSKYKYLVHLHELSRLRCYLDFPWHLENSCLNMIDVSAAAQSSSATEQQRAQVIPRCGELSNEKSSCKNKDLSLVSDFRSWEMGASKPYYRRVCSVSNESLREKVASDQESNS
jgi:hypothetical protein